MPRERKTDAEHIYAGRLNASGRRSGAGGWNVPSNRRSRRMYMTGWKRRWARLANRDKVLSLIGLAMKAGRCASGEMMTENETKAGKAKLVIVAYDAS